MWGSIKTRCTPGSTAQARNPTYKECRLGGSFTDFNKFADWYTSQLGYGISGMQVDKDLLVEGNKIYSEEYCVLIPQGLNTFLVSSPSRKGDFPIGVSFRNNSGLFRAQIRIDGVTKLLGDYSTPEKAKTAYDAAKIKEANRWADRIENKEFVVDERVVLRLRSWQPK